MATQAIASNQRTDFSRRVFQANSLVTALAGLGLILDAGSIAQLMGLDAPVVLEICGAGFLIYAAVLFRVAARGPIARRTLLTFASGEWAWAVLCLLAVIDGWPSATADGKWLIGLIATVSAVFGDAMFVAAWRMRK